MFAALSTKERTQGSSQTSNKDTTRSGSKVNKKAHAAEVTFPPLRPEASCLLTAPADRRLFSHTAIFKNAPPDKPLSLLDLPRLIAEVGTKKAIAETKWKEGPRLMAATLGTAIPTGLTQLKAESRVEKDEPVKVPECTGEKITKDENVTKPAAFPHTGTDVVQMFAQKPDPGELELFYLKEAEGDTYRPYDLQVVHASEAGPEHYIFSPSTVIHVTKTGFGGVVSLTEWYREHVLWTALQEIPFFRNFRVQKAFTRWYKNMCTIHFQRKCTNLQDILLVAVPQFRRGLHLLTTVIEELKETHLMYLDDSEAYTLLEFKEMLIIKNEKSLLKLERLSHYRAVILNAVREESYKKHKELQIRLKLAKRQTRCSEPIHLLLAYQHQLKKELCQSAKVLQKLGSFSALVHQMIVQSLVTVTQQDGLSFLRFLKRASSRQCCLFYTDLCFSFISQLTVDPPVHEFYKTVSECALFAVSTVIQMCEKMGFFREISNNVCNSDQSLISDCSCVHYSGENNDKMTDLPLREIPNHQLLQSEATSLKVQSNMVRGCCYPLSKTQLEWHISVSDVTRQVETEQAKIMQDTELEIQQALRSYSWLKDVHLFVTQWSPASLESMKDQPAALYEEHIKNLCAWAQRINTVDSFICTSNQLFLVSCTRTKEALRQQLYLIEEQILEQLVEQAKVKSESFISDLVKTSDELKSEPQDVHDFSVYALRVRESVNMLADTQRRLEYILSLHDTIIINYRKMTEQELTLKEKMLSLWDDFISLLKQADSHMCLPSVTNALDTMVSFLACDLKNIVFKATSGPFLDPNQNANEMVSKLNYMCAHVRSLSTKLEELNRSSQNMQEHPLDLTILTADVRKVTARKELWQLKAAFAAWLEDWKQLQLSESEVFHYGNHLSVTNYGSSNDITSVCDRQVEP